MTGSGRRAHLSVWVQRTLSLVFTCLIHVARAILYRFLFIINCSNYRAACDFEITAINVITSSTKDKLIYDRDCSTIKKWFRCMDED